MLKSLPADAGKRLGAAVLDWTGPVAVLIVLFAVGFAGVTQTRGGGSITYNTSSLVLFGGIGIGLTVAYTLVQALIEARSGVTLGNRLMGIRSADADGYAPGGGAVFLRGLVTGAGVLLAALAAVLVVAFQWFSAALWILGPLVLLGAAWAVLVVVSNTWDRNGRLRGWHDAAAKTLVFDIKAGRNPLATGGIQGPYSFAPLDLPPVQQVASPVAGAARLPRGTSPTASPTAGSDRGGPQPGREQPRLQRPPGRRPRPHPGPRRQLRPGHRGHLADPDRRRPGSRTGPGHADRAQPRRPARRGLRAAAARGRSGTLHLQDPPPCAGRKRRHLGDGPQLHQRQRGHDAGRHPHRTGTRGTHPRTPRIHRALR